MWQVTVVEDHSGPLRLLLPHDLTTCFPSAVAAVPSAPLCSSATLFAGSRLPHQCMPAQPFSIQYCHYFLNAAGKWRSCHYFLNAAGKWRSLRQCHLRPPLQLRPQYFLNAAGKWRSLRRCHRRLPLQLRPQTAPPRPQCWAATTWTWTLSRPAASSAQAQFLGLPPPLTPRLHRLQPAPLLPHRWHRCSQVGRVTGRVTQLIVAHWFRSAGWLSSALLGPRIRLVCSLWGGLCLHQLQQTGGRGYWLGSPTACQLQFLERRQCPLLITSPSSSQQVACVGCPCLHQPQRTNEQGYRLGGV